MRVTTTLRAMPRVAIAICVTIAGAAIMTACKGEPPHQRGLEGGLPVLRVSDKPTLVIGDNGTPERAFSGVSARELPSGDIIIGDQGSMTVRVFARDGHVVRRLARRGHGPGELSGTFLLTTCGDTVFTLGQPPGSSPLVNVYNASHGFESSFLPHAATGAMFTPISCLSTGQLLVSRGRPMMMFRKPPEPGTLMPDTVRFGLFSGRSTNSRGLIEWVAPVIHRWLVVYPWRHGPIPAALAPFRLGPVVSVVASGDRVWIVDGGSGVVRGLDGAGHALVIDTLPLKPTPFDGTALRQARHRSLRGASTALDTARVEATFDPSVRPPTMPVASGALAGANGNLWVRLFNLDDSAPPDYLMLNRVGQAVARVSLPTGLDVQQIGSHFVLGVERDSLGVESVVEYGIVRR